MNPTFRNFAEALGIAHLTTRWKDEWWPESGRPTAFALTELTAADEARIGALVKKAVR